MSEFDNWKEEQERIHNDYDAENAWYAGQQSQQTKIELLEKELTETQAFLNNQNHIKQAKIDELQARIDETLIEMKNQLGDEDFCDMQRPDYDAMLYALRNIKDILKGNKDEN